MSICLNYKPEVLVSTEGLTNEQWLEYRRLGIGGSDAAAVMGLSPFCTMRDLYYDKCGIQAVMEEEESNWVAKQVGHRLEDLVAEIFSVKTGLKVYPVRKMFKHPLFPFMLADVDFFIDFGDGRTGILECKTTNYNCQNKWANDSVPVNYEYQGRHYMAVMNLDEVYFACLYGNNENEFIIRHMERDLDMEEEFDCRGSKFLEGVCTEEDRTAIHRKTGLVLESIRRHYGPAEKDSETVKLSPKHLQSVNQYLNWKEQRAECKKRK